MGSVTQEVSEVVASVDALAGLLEMEPRGAQELVTREPRCSQGHLHLQPSHDGCEEVTRQRCAPIARKYPAQREACMHACQPVCRHGEEAVQGMGSTTSGCACIKQEVCIASSETLSGHVCRFLDVEAVREVLEEMRRLMPQADARAALRRDPGWLTRVERGVRRLGPHPDDI